MSVVEKNIALKKFRSAIESLEREEMMMVMRIHGDVLNQIVTIARENNLALQHIEHALKLRQPKEKVARVPRKKKNSEVTASAPL